MITGIGSSTHNIDVIARFKEEGFEKLNKLSKNMNNFLGGTANQGFFKTMKMSLPEWQKFNKTGGKFNTLGGHIANSFRKATHGLKGFKMEMLGIMFFGMAMHRTFNGLLKTSIEWLGVTKIFSEALGILFLPVAELLLNWALLFLDWVLKLTPEQKKLIGLFVLFGAAIGAVIMVIGTLALGIGSLIQAFGWLLSPIGAVISLFIGLLAFTVLKAMFSENADAVDSLKNKLEAFGISGEVFDNMVEKVKNFADKAGEFLGSMVDKLFENTDKIAEALDKLFDAMANWISNHIDDLTKLGLKIGGTIVKGIGKALMGIGFGIGDWLSEKMGIRSKYERSTYSKVFHPYELTQRDIENINYVSNFKHGPPSQQYMSIAPTYNVNVSDKSEFERMLELNNNELVFQIQSGVKT